MCTALACPIIPVIRISMAYSSCRQNKPRSKATRPLKPTVNVHTIYHVHQCNITCVLLLTVNSHIRLSILRIVVTKTFAQGQPVEICSLNFLLLPLCFCYATLPPPPPFNPPSIHTCWSHSPITLSSVAFISTFCPSWLLSMILPVAIKEQPWVMVLGMLLEKECVCQNKLSLTMGCHLCQ